jgi:acyl-CoA synthetase (AMP-forming)/AMP-acid ligase II
VTPSIQRTEWNQAIERVVATAGLSIALDAAPIPDGPQTLQQLVRQRAHLGPVEAFVAPDGRLAYGDIEAAVARAAGALVGLGVRPGDRVAASMPNSVSIIVAFLAVQRIGGIWVGLNMALSASEKAYILDHCGARVLLADQSVARSLADQRATLPGLADLVEATPGSGSTWASMLAAATPLDADWPEADPHHPAAIAYTSGTTGFPKGACHSQHNILVPPAIQRYKGHFGPGMRQGQPLPFTILNIMIVGPVTSLMCSATTVAVERNSAMGIVDAVRDERLDGFLVAPPTMHDLVADERIRPEDLRGVQRPGSGGADTSDSLRARFQEKFGSRVTVGYGMTEAPTAVVAEDPTLPPVPGACGIASPHVVVTVRDDAGNELPTGEEGELCVAGRSDGPWAGVYSPMLGYWRQPEASAKVLGEGFYRTGDIGRLDADGNCFVRARKSEMILRGGSNIFPAEIENVLQKHPGVRSSVALGRPHERLGEEVVVVVEPKPGCTVEIAELTELCREHLSRYKVPAEFVLTESLPRNQMDKIVRRRVREEILGLA